MAHCHYHSSKNGPQAVSGSKLSKTFCAKVFLLLGLDVYIFIYFSLFCVSFNSNFSGSHAEPICEVRTYFNLSSAIHARWVKEEHTFFYPFTHPPTKLRADITLLPTHLARADIADIPFHPPTQQEPTYPFTHPPSKSQHTPSPTHPARANIPLHPPT